MDDFLEDFEDDFSSIVNLVKEELDADMKAAAKEALRGDPGKDGVPGKPGKPGSNGVGKPGKKGEPGLKGDRGKPGEDGVNGEDGQPGEPGLPGPPGERGPAGHGGKGGRVTGGYSGGSGGPGPQGETGASGLVALTIVYVTQASQLAGTLDSSKLYLIDGKIDMGSTSIVVPTSGLSIAGVSINTACLFSSADNYTLFVCNASTYCGDLSVVNIGLQITGTGSEVFELNNRENGGRIGWQSVNFISCTSLGTISSFSQALAQNIGWRDCAEGLTCDGVWTGGLAVLNSILLGTPFPGTLFKAGSGLSIGGSFRSNINILRLDASNGTFCDFAPSNIVLDAGFALTTVRVNPLADPLPNMPATSVKALIKDCIGLENTHQGASISPDVDSVIVITEQNTLVQVTGAATISDAYWFSKANTNGLQSDSTLSLEVRCDGILSFSGSSGVELGVQFRKFHSSSSQYTDIGPEYNTTIFGTVFPLASNVAFAANTTMEKDDRIEVWVKNRDNTDNITLKSGGQFQVAER